MQSDRSVCEPAKTITDLNQVRMKDYSLYDGRTTQQNSPGLGIEFLTFAGGGVSGLSYIGVLEVFQRERILDSIKYFLGSSSGALIATFAVLGASAEYIQTRLSEVDLGSMFKICGNKYNAANPVSKVVCAYYSIPEIIKDFGIISPQPFLNWIGDCMNDLGYSEEITFEELYYATGKHLIITTCCLNTFSKIELSHLTYPKMKVLDALNATILIPFILKPVKLNDPNVPEGYRLLSDGGVLDNLPLNCCDVVANDGEILGYNRKVVGFLPVKDGAWYDDYIPIDTVVDYGLAVMRIMHAKIHMDRSNQEYFWNRVVPIETGDVSPFNFDVSGESAIKLIISGRNAAEKFIRERKEMITREGALPQNLFIPNLRLRCCGSTLDDSLLKQTEIYRQKKKENKVPI